jgi:hypothetical protein
VLLAIVEASDFTPSELADPELAARVATAVMDEINPWRGTTPAVLERLALESPARRPLAERLAAAPELDGWFAPLHRARPQLWSSYTDHVKPFGPGLNRAKNGPMSPWEGYAHKPHPTVLTSTPFDDDLSSLVITTALGVNDLHMYDNAPIRRRRLSVRPDARVYEITGPKAWAALARAYPYVSHEGHHVEQGPDGLSYTSDRATLVPDWPAVARDWDGVHVSLGAMLLSTEVPILDDAGRSALWAWDAEGTYWLRWAFEDEVILPAIDEQALEVSGSGTDPASRISWPASLWHRALMEGDGPEARKLRSSHMEAQSRLSRSPATGLQRIREAARRRLP